MNNGNYTEKAKSLLDSFLTRTGIMDTGGDISRRYLWTDAFAVQACFSLNHILENKDYLNFGLRLIREVHNHLGSHRPDDRRKGWISGLSRKEGEEHPTVNGLRIGKKLPEKPEGDPFYQRLEWERDGQYFHYLTRWFNALHQAYAETNEKTYARWAVELIGTGRKFIYKEDHGIGMVWKMNIDLTEAVVESMGAHDPLEGLICVLSAKNILTTKEQQLMNLESDFERLCRPMNWYTTDALGIGGLLLNVARTSELELNDHLLPSSVKPAKLLKDALTGLSNFQINYFDPQQPADTRLAFRECGLSLGIRVLIGMRDRFTNIDLSELKNYQSIAEEIELFWLDPSSRQALTWRDHLDINAVTLASSLLAREHPNAFCATSIR